MGQGKEGIQKGQLGLNPPENPGRCLEPMPQRGLKCGTAPDEGYTGGPLILGHFQPATSEGRTGLTGQESPQVKRCWQLVSQANVHRNGQDRGHQ